MTVFYITSHISYIACIDKLGLLSLKIMHKHRRSQEFVLGGPDNWGAEDAEIETPKASRGKGMGRGCPPPQPTRVSGGAS